MNLGKSGEWIESKYLGARKAGKRGNRFFVLTHDGDFNGVTKLYYKLRLAKGNVMGF